MEPRLLGWPTDGPTLRLDYRRYAYAGKFVMSGTGKAVLAPDGWEHEEADRTETDPGDGESTDSMESSVLAAVAFDVDRTDSDALRLRYVTVRDDRRGEGLGPRLCTFVCERAAGREFERVRIAVNNPYSYEALYRAGFGFTGETTGIAEVVLERPAVEPAARNPEQYRAGLDAVADREDLTDGEVAFAREKRERGPPGTTATR
ncbi:GNAT family N-acetyltransferase [Halorarum halophilum]|uniref:GNAT family N-acetyltransferase n=1 Tax=Halorarum halophilum TaxID=2743090 RepID=A0A7D5K6K7_9EURY|nr:GNAT family N-acetyltransferase [Halobaculum halophilum]QLG26819.1 GNAT family N-acetyltransferase [Halobaculum halophilum]